MAEKRYYSDLRAMAKRANQRMLRLERAGISSPAYQAAQSKLEILGRTSSGNRGRRFSETGRATYNEMEATKKVLEDFLNATTSTISGEVDFRKRVWNSANTNNQLDEAGITRKDWEEFWESMPSEKDRLYGSDQIVAIIRAYSQKNGELQDEDKLTMEEIADKIQSSKNLKSAYRSLGITSKEVINARPLQPGE